MKQYLPSANNTGTVNDCAENKCINCFNNNGCIYRRSAYEMPQQEAAVTKNNTRELQQIKSTTERTLNYRFTM
jgi:hypothetical protein